MLDIWGDGKILKYSLFPTPILWDPYPALTVITSWPLIVYLLVYFVIICALTPTHTNFIRAGILSVYCFISSG